jgi:DNA-binding SARP family transcriptional activator/predicted ATPase
MAEALRIEILGPLRVLREGAEVAMTSQRQRIVLSCLLARDGPMSASTLIEATWGASQLPARPAAALHTVVSRLRTTLGPQAAIRQQAAGYVLAFTQDAVVDVRRFDALVTASATSTGDTDEAGCLREALNLWRGHAWEGFEDVPNVAADAARLDEARLQTTERLAGLLTASGAAHEAIGLLRDLVDEQPYRESGRIGLMTALHRAGRTTEALDAYHGHRERLIEDLGLDPSPRMVEVHRRILANDPQPDRSTAPMDNVARPLAIPSSSPLVGRDADADLLTRSIRTSRLVTVTGMGGVGKSRLVAQVLPDLAAALGQRLVTVHCEGMASSHELPGAVGVALGTTAHGPELLERLAATCEAAPTLLVLDGCEQVANSASKWIEDLLARAPALRVVATSRVPLASPHEQLVRLAPLPVDETTASVDDLLVLFVSAGRRADPDFALSAEGRHIAFEVCQLLEGLPLAIELAGARAAMVGLHPLRRTLASGVQVIDDAAADPRRSLQGILEWTFQSLDSDAAELLARLSVAPGPIDLQLAESLAPPPVRGQVTAALDQLLQHALLVRGSGTPEPTYRLLEMIRRFARSRLNDTSRSETEGALIGWAHTLATEAIPAASGPDDRSILDHLNAHAPNLVQALCLAHDHQPDKVDTLAGRLALISSHRMPLQLFEPIWQIGHTAGRSHRPRPLVMAAAARVATLRGDYANGLELGQRAWQHAGDDPQVRYLAAHTLAIASLYTGHHNDATRWCHRLLANHDLTVAHHADFHTTLALLAVYNDDLPTARREVQTALTFAATSGASVYRAFAAYAAGEVAIRAGDHDQARTRLREATRAAVDASASFIEALASTALASLLVRTDDSRAAGTLHRVLAHWRQMGTWPQIWTTVRLIGEHCARHDDHETALLLLEVAHHHPQAPEITGQDAERGHRLRAAARTHLDDGAAARLEELARIITPAATINRALTACAPRHHAAAT